MYYFYHVFWIILLLAVSHVTGLFFSSSFLPWYETLIKSSYTPPSIVFPIVWTVLYVLIGLGGGVLWRLKDSVKKKMMQGLYILQVLLNWTWSPLFFHYHEIVSSLCVIGIMILLLLVLYYCIFENREKQWQLGLLFLPYLCWLFFACYLNGYIVFYN